MVTIEYHVHFTKPVSEFSLVYLSTFVSHSVIDNNLKYIIVETTLNEREFLKLLSETVDVEKIGLIKHVRLLEPDWFFLKETYA